METVRVQCCVAGCGHSPFPMAKSFYVRARRTHESWFCPAGHEQHFAEQSEEEKLRAEVERLRRQVDTFREAFHHWWDEARQCPWPTCRDHVYADRASLYAHMRRMHGMPLVAEVTEQAS